MVELPEGFSGLSINTYFKYILYLAGILLILSFVVDFNAIDVSRFRQICFAVIVAGCLIWFSNEIIMDQVAQKRAHAKLDNDFERYLSHWKTLNLIYIGIQITVWILLFLYL